MDKVLNRRYVLGVALCLCAGAVTGGVLLENLILQIVIPVAVVAIGIVLFFCKRKFLFFALFFFALGAAILSVDYAVSRTDLREGYYFFEGRVAETTESFVRFDGVFLDEEKSVGKAQGKRKDFPSVEVGDVVKVFVKVENIEVDFFDSYSASLYNDRVYRKITPYGEIKKIGERKGVFERIRSRIRDALARYCSDEDAGISMSLLFGDKSDLSAFDEEMVKGIGMSHVFAVSGLHVGFLTAIAIFLMKKLRLTPLPQFLLTGVLLLLYGLLTGFPAGLKRAAVMALLYLAAPLVRGKADSVTALGVASFLIVLTNPREVLDIGFLMSVSAIAGILLFYTPFARGIDRVIRQKIVKKGFDAVALTIAANLFLLPIILNVFGSVAPYAPLGNLLLLPVVTATYTYLAIVTPIACVIPTFAFLYYPIKYPYNLIRAIGTGICSLPYATLSLPSIGVFSLLYVFGLLFLSRLNKLSFKVKIPVSAILFLTSSVGFFL